PFSALSSFLSLSSSLSSSFLSSALAASNFPSDGLPAIPSPGPSILISLAEKRDLRSSSNSWRVSSIRSVKLLVKFASMLSPMFELPLKVTRPFLRDRYVHEFQQLTHQHCLSIECH